MKIKVDWYNPEKTIILQKREPGWTWQDFDVAVDQYVSLAGSVDHNVAIIVDSLDAPQSPTSSVLAHYQRADRLKPDNLVLMVIVTKEGGFMQTIGQIFGRVSSSVRKFLHFVRSIEKAESLCNKVLASESSKDQSGR